MKMILKVNAFLNFSRIFIYCAGNKDEEDEGMDDVPEPLDWQYYEQRNSKYRIQGKLAWRISEMDMRVYQANNW